MKNKIRFSAFLYIIPISLFFVFEAQGAEFKVQPAVKAGEEYNDNILLRHDDRVDDYITSVVPSLYSLYQAPLWDWDMTFSYNYHHYAKNDISDASYPRLNLANHTRIVKEHVFLDIRDVYDRTSLNVVRDYTQESFIVNQTNTNALIVNPYFVVYPSSQMSVTTGYQYRNLWYKDSSAIDKIEQSGYAEAKQELSSKATMTVGARYVDTETDVQNYPRTDVYAGPRYEYAEGSSLWLTIGNSWFDLQNGERTSQVFWDTGINHKLGTVTLAFNTALSYIDDPTRIVRREDRYVMTIRKETERTALSLSAALREYRGPISKHLQQRSYTASGMVSHAITRDLKVVLDLTIQRIEDYEVYTTTSIYRSGARLEQVLSKNLTGSLEYRYANSYSPEAYATNYYNNRIIAEISKKF